MNLIKWKGFSPLYYVKIVPHASSHFMTRTGKTKRGRLRGNNNRSSRMPGKNWKVSNSHLKRLEQVSVPTRLKEKKKKNLLQQIAVTFLVCDFKKSAKQWLLCNKKIKTETVLMNSRLVPVLTPDLTVALTGSWAAQLLLWSSEEEVKWLLVNSGRVAAKVTDKWLAWVNWVEMFLSCQSCLCLLSESTSDSHTSAVKISAISILKQ